MRSEFHLQPGALKTWAYDADTTVPALYNDGVTIGEGTYYVRSGLSLSAIEMVGAWVMQSGSPVVQNAAEEQVRKNLLQSETPMLIWLHTPWVRSIVDDRAC